MSSGGSSLARALHREAEQLSLLGADVDPAELDAMRGKDGRLPSNAFRLARSQRTGKPGRPLGAGNKRSEQLAKLVIQEFGDPVLGGASLYAMPLDQLCELLLVADGTQEREERLEELTGALAAQVSELAISVRQAAKDGNAGDLEKAADRIADATESLESLAKSRGKAGTLALNALNVQLTARRFVAEYVHSKRPTAVDVTVKRDGVLVMPGMGGGDDVGAVQQQLDDAMKSGLIDAEQVARLEFRDGRLHDPEGEIEDAEFAPVGEDGGEAE